MAEAWDAIVNPWLQGQGSGIEVHFDAQLRFVSVVDDAEVVSESYVASCTAATQVDAPPPGGITEDAEMRATVAQLSRTLRAIEAKIDRLAVPTAGGLDVRVRSTAGDEQIARPAHRTPPPGPRRASSP